MKNNIEYLDKIVKILEPPYFHVMEEHYGINDKEEQEYILSKVYGDIRIDLSFCNIIDSSGKLLYHERIDSYWTKYEYDSVGNQIYWFDSYGFWVKREYNSNRRVISYKNSDNF
jgi:hypothetical protein